MKYSDSEINKCCDEIKALGYNFHYYPSTSTHIQCGIFLTKVCLEKLADEGYLERVIVPVYQSGADRTFFEELAKPNKKDIDLSECQDPDDYRQLTKHDLEFVDAYRRSKKKKK